MSADTPSDSFPHNIVRTSLSLAVPRNQDLQGSFGGRQAGTHTPTTIAWKLCVPLLSLWDQHGAQRKTADWYWIPIFFFFFSGRGGHLFILYQIRESCRVTVFNFHIDWTSRKANELKYMRSQDQDIGLTLCCPVSQSGWGRWGQKGNYIFFKFCLSYLIFRISKFRRPSIHIKDESPSHHPVWNIQIQMKM